MAIIDSKGLFFGDRIGSCSDEAQLHWPRIFAASNTYARIELNYTKILLTAYSSLKVKPSREKLFEWIDEYKNNFLLFTYHSDSGSLWGQWLTNKEYLNKYHTAEDKRSPAPPDEAMEAFRLEYINHKKSKSNIINDLEKPFQTIPLGIGEGIGNGKYIAAQPLANSDKQAIDPKSRDERHTPFRKKIEEYWMFNNKHQLPWNGSEAKKLSLFLEANPNIQLEDFAQLLRNRQKSEENHSERPRVWIESLNRYGSGPLDRFGKPKNGKITNSRSTLIESRDEIRAEIRHAHSVSGRVLHNLESGAVKTASTNLLEVPRKVHD